MGAGAPRADFKLVLTAINPAQLPAIVAELMDIFLLDRKTATEAAQNTPIVLLGGMTRAQAANIRTYLTRLQKLGAQMSLTAEPVGKLKQLRWQALPPIVRRPASLFVCPTCGERFVVQRWQPAPAQPAPPAAPPPPPTAEAVPEAQPLEAEPVAEAVPAEEIEPVEAEELPVADLESEPAEAIPVAEALPVEEPAPRPAPAPQPARPPRPAKPAPAAPRPAPAAPKPQPEPAAGPRYDVSVARVSGARQQRLAELLADRQGIGLDEAERQCGRTVVLVCKDATSAEADEWRKALLGIGIKPRIRKRSG